MNHGYRLLLLPVLWTAFIVAALGQESIEAQRGRFNGVWVYSDKENKKKKSPEDESRIITISYSAPKFSIEVSGIASNKAFSISRTFNTDGRTETNRSGEVVEIDPKTLWEKSVLLHNYKMIFETGQAPKTKLIAQIDVAEKYRVSDNGDLLYVTAERKWTSLTESGKPQEGGTRESGTLVYKRKN